MTAKNQFFTHYMFWWTWINNTTLPYCVYIYLFLHIFVISWGHDENMKGASLAARNCQEFLTLISLGLEFSLFVCFLTSIFVGLKSATGHLILTTCHCHGSGPGLRNIGRMQVRQFYFICNFLIQGPEATYCLLFYYLTWSLFIKHCPTIQELRHYGVRALSATTHIAHLSSSIQSMWELLLLQKGGGIQLEGRKKRCCEKWFVSKGGGQGTGWSSEGES